MIDLKHELNRMDFNELDDGSKLQALMKKKGLTLKGIAKEVGTSHTHVGRIVRGEVEKSQYQDKIFSMILGIEGE